MKKSVVVSIGVVALAVLSVLGLAAAKAERAQGAATQLPYRNVTPAQLEAMLRQKDFVLVNVHVPYEGEIRRTDAFLPYTEVDAKAPRLFPDRRAKIVVYCRTGRMSAIAANALVRLGYSRVLNLDGGMVAWERAGYPLVRR